MSTIRLIVDIRIKSGSQDALRGAYAALREHVVKQPGLIGHQLCESLEDPDRWLVISEWESIDASSAWDRSDEHARLLAPMRACFAQASRAGFEVRDGGTV